MESLAVCILMLAAATGEDITISHSSVGDTSILQSPDYPEYPPAGTKQVWQLTAAEGCKILLSCPHIYIRQEIGCFAGSLTVEDEQSRIPMCEVKDDYQQLSAGRKLTVRFSTGLLQSAKFECVATSKPARDSK